MNPKKDLKIQKSKLKITENEAVPENKHPEVRRRLGYSEDSEIKEEFMPKSGIQKMENSMLCSANVAIHLSPVLHQIRIYEVFVIFWIHKPQIIPARSCPLWHRIGLALPCEITRKSNIHKIRNKYEWTIAITCWFVVLYFWELEWEIVITYYLSVKSVIDFGNNFSSNNKFANFITT